MQGFQAVERRELGFPTINLSENLNRDLYIQPLHNHFSISNLKLKKILSIKSRTIRIVNIWFKLQLKMLYNKVIYNFNFIRVNLKSKIIFHL